MNHAKPLLMSVGAAYQRHPARMFLRPEQHSHIAAAYDKAAFDISLPAQTRAALIALTLLILSASREAKQACSPECLLLALSGLSDALITRSAFGPKADMPNEHVECPLMTQSGNRHTSLQVTAMMPTRNPNTGVARKIYEYTP